MTPAASHDVPFAVVATTGMSAYDGASAVMIGASDGSRARLVQLVPAAVTPAGRVLVAAFQGAQRTGGYGIAIDRIERDGDQLIVHAAFTEPRPDSIVIQVLTSPAQIVSIASADLAAVHRVRLLDANGVERAQASVG